MLSRIIKEVKKKAELLQSFEKVQIVVKQGNTTVIEKWYFPNDVTQLVQECSGREIKQGKLWEICGLIINSYSRLAAFVDLKIYLAGYGASVVTPEPFDIPYKKIFKFVEECKKLKSMLH